MGSLSAERAIVACSNPGCGEELTTFEQEITRENGLVMCSYCLRSSSRREQLAQREQRAIETAARRADAVLRVVGECSGCGRPSEEDPCPSCLAGGEPTPAEPADAENAEQDRGWTRLSEIEKRSIRYVDKPLWQWGAFHVLVARKGKGKGTSTASLAAQFTRGEFGRKRTVIWIGTEDSPSVDIRPRLEAAGGLPEHVVFVTRHLSLPADIGRLRDLAAELGDVGLIVIDPLGNHVGGINTNWDGHVRDAIQGLNPLADELDVVIVGIRHLTEKEAKDLRAGVLGASAWLQVPRVAIAIVDDPADPALKHMHAFMGNRGRPGESGRQFRIEGVLLDGLEEEVTVAVWDGDSTVDIEELFASANGDDAGKAPSRSARAREYILDVHDQEGEQESDALDARVVKATGLAAKTVRNLRSELSDQGLVKAVPVKERFRLSHRVACSADEGSA